MKRKKISQKPEITPIMKDFCLGASVEIRVEQDIFDSVLNLLNSITDSTGEEKPVGSFHHIPSNPGYKDSKIIIIFSRLTDFLDLNLGYEFTIKFIDSLNQIVKSPFDKHLDLPLIDCFRIGVLIVEL